VSAGEVAARFVAAINAHDPAALAALMSEDHRFIDATGAVHGPDEMRDGWRQYFATFPDYRIAVEVTTEAGEAVGLFGWASGSHAGRAWRFPAAWLAIVRGDQLAEWRVFCDVEPMLRSMGAGRF
jgi:ketosteroid isomerase-like protein